MYEWVMYNSLAFNGFPGLSDPIFPISLTRIFKCFIISEDEVYMNSAEDLKEYVLRQNGIVYQGSNSRPYSKRWYFGQVKNNFYLFWCFLSEHLHTRLNYSFSSLDYSYDIIINMKFESKTLFVKLFLSGMNPKS